MYYIIVAHNVVSDKQMVIYAYHVDIFEDKKAYGTFPLSVVLLNYIKGQ